MTENEKEFEKEREHAKKVQKDRKLITIGSYSFLETNLMKKKRLMAERIQRERQEKEAESKLMAREKERDARNQQIEETISETVGGSVEVAMIAIFSRILSEQREFRDSTIRALNLIGKQNNRIDDLLVKLVEQTEKLIELFKLVQK